MPIVLVELPAADAADVNAPALIAACTSGLRRGSCATEEEPDGEPATAVAIVAWLDAEHLHARIDVGRRAEQRGGWQVRELTFHEQDALIERFRSVGLAIAGVVGEATLLEPATPAAPASATSERAPPLPAAERVRAFRIALGPALESGLSVGQPALGAWLDLGWRAFAAVPLELTVTGAHALSLSESAGLASRFSSFGLGLSATLQVAPQLGLRGSLFAGLGALDASANDRATGARASEARWLFAGFGRVQAVWPWGKRVSGVLGLEIIRFSGATELQIHDQTRALSPAFSGGIQAGLEWQP
jgi:hypothetical protein